MLVELYASAALQIGSLLAMTVTPRSIIAAPFGNIDIGENNPFEAYSQPSARWGGFVEETSSSAFSTKSFLNQGQFPLFILEKEESPLVLSTEVEKLRDKLDGYAKLPSDWAGEDTVLPTLQTVSQAKALVSNLSSDSLLPHLSASMDGEIGFTWILKDHRVEAVLSPEGEFAWLCKDDKEIISYGQEGVNEALPDELTNFIAIRRDTYSLAS